MPITLQLLKIGTKVRIKQSQIEAVVTEIWIKGEPDSMDVLYQVTWWSGRDIKDHYIRSYEIETITNAVLKIGFK